ncbi:MAG: PepSY domain-containing protein [Alphaproteobacteria bacterium]|nr:PepSY domain-containing protein [Alphaproteobacteria bacterium]
MRIITSLTAVTLLLGPVGAALADRADPGRVQPVPAVSTATIKAELEDMGYDVVKLKLDGGRYKARIVDRETKGVVKASFDASTGELMRARLAD